MTLGLDLEVLLLPHPFSRYLHVLVGDDGTPEEGEARLDALADAAPDPYAVSLVEMLASAAALTIGEPAWAERAARRGIGADPETTFSFWGRGLHGYLAAALIDQGRIDEGLPLLEAAIDQYVAAGGRTGVVVYRASMAAGLTEAGRLDEAGPAVAAAYHELERYGERFGEPLVLEADARLHLARGDHDGAVALFGQAVDLATAQGALAVARRVATNARRRGVEVDA
jgi:tetratricopeptide (TPR) repeat protein